MLTTGIKGFKEEIVSISNSAKHLGSGDLEVYGTPAMIALMEATARESVQPFLEEGRSTVGVHISADHSAPSPLGMKVVCNSELIEIDRKMLTFQITVADEQGEIGRATHKRFIIQKEAFLEKAESRKSI